MAFAFEPLQESDPFEIGGYRLLASLGAGGMGQVYLSFTPGGRAVAIKTVRRELAADLEFRRRFTLEVRAAQRVNGIHIAPLIDEGAEAPVPWLATVYVPGPSLAEAVQLTGPLPVPLVRTIVVAIARALTAIHEAGLVHRDLKPANVILGPEGPRVIDFGVVRAADASGLSRSGVQIGTPQYMSPEQVQGDPVAPAADVFALGSLAYHVATGQPTFGEGSGVTIVYRIIEQEPSLDGCPSELLPLIRACLAKDPARRPTPAEIISAWGEESPGGVPSEIGRAIAERGRALASVATSPRPAPIPHATLPTRSVVSGTRRPWLLALGALLLVAGVAIGVTVASSFSGGGGGDPQNGATSQPTALAKSSSGAPPSSDAPTGLASEPAPSVKIRWQGDISFSYWQSIDVDPLPPSKNKDVDDSTEDLQGFGDTISAGDQLALWTGRTTPTLQDCSDLISTQGEGRVKGAANQLICLKTSEGRIGLIRVKSFVNSSSDTKVTARALIWDNPAQ